MRYPPKRTYLEGLITTLDEVDQAAEWVVADCQISIREPDHADGEWVRQGLAAPRQEVDHSAAIHRSVGA